MVLVVPLVRPLLLLLLLATFCCCASEESPPPAAPPPPWAVEHRRNNASHLSTEKMPMEARVEMREAARSMFIHGYDSYMAAAYPAAELDPVGCKGQRMKPVNVPLMTLIDLTSSLAIMGNATEFCRVVRLISDQADFDIDVNVSVFETTIRVLGGLLSAHLLATDPELDLWDDEQQGYGGELLELALDLGGRMLPAFETRTGIPYGTVNLMHGVPAGETEVSNLAGAGSLTLEFSALSALTGDWRFSFAAEGAVKAIWMRRSRLSLVGKHINIQSGRWSESTSGVGANGDSFYEYLLKFYVLWGDLTYWDMFSEAMLALLKHARMGDWYVDVDMTSGQLLRAGFDNLMAFVPGLLVHAGDAHAAARSLNAFYLVWRDMGFIPEVFDFVRWMPHSWHEEDRSGYAYLLRPELIESTLWTYRATRDQSWLWAGVDFYDSIESLCRTPCGYAVIEDIDTMELGDCMPSYFLAETATYLYMLYDEDNFSLGENWIFTTEAHPLKIPAIRSGGGRDLNAAARARRSAAVPVYDEHVSSLPGLKYLRNKFHNIFSLGSSSSSLSLSSFLQPSPEPADRWRDSRLPQMIRRLRGLWTGHHERLAYLDFLAVSYFDAVCPHLTWWTSPFGYVENFQDTLSEVGLWNAAGGGAYPEHMVDRVRVSGGLASPTCQSNTIRPAGQQPPTHPGKLNKGVLEVRIEDLGSFIVEAFVDSILIKHMETGRTLEVRHMSELALMDSTLFVLEYDDDENDPEGLAEGGRRGARGIYVGDKGLMTYCTVSLLRMHHCAPATFGMRTTAIFPVVESPMVQPPDIVGCEVPQGADGQHSHASRFGRKGQHPSTQHRLYAGKVVLIMRGGCMFQEKALIAQAAGAEAVVIVNNEPGENIFMMDAAVGTFGEDGLLREEGFGEAEGKGEGEEGGGPPSPAGRHHPPLIRIPVVMVSYQDGQEILEVVRAAEAIGVGQLRLRVDISTVHQALMEPLMGLGPSDAQSWLDGVASSMTNSKSSRLSSPLMELSPSTLRGFRRPPFALPRIVTSHESNTVQIMTSDWSVLLSSPGYGGGYQLYILKESNDRQEAPSLPDDGLA